jgi:hyperosmotically inducible protein
MRAKFLFIAITLSVFVACKSGPSDQDLQKQIAGTVSSAYPGVTASVNDGVVTLTGTCPDQACKSGSESAAQGVKGVKSVVNNITVTPPAPTVSAPDIAADDSLKTSLNNLLSAYKTVNGQVENGVVTLTGEIRRSQLTTLMQSVNELKPKKVENQLVIK